MASVGRRPARFAVAERRRVCCSWSVAKPTSGENVSRNVWRGRGGDLAGGLALLGAALAAYAPALRGGLLWDDAAHVTAAGLRSLGGLGRIWSELGATQQYYPVLHSAFWLEHRLWGDAVLGYHLVNVGLHALAAWLVAIAVRRVFAIEGLAGAGEVRQQERARTAGWLAAGIFVLHPVAVESVAWISEQKNTLSAVFYLAALLAYLRFDRERSARRYAVATGWFALALLTKTVTATLPAELLVILWWRRGRLRGREDVGPLTPWFALSLVAGATTAWVERTLIGAEGADFSLSAVERGLLAGRALWFYLGKLLWPADLIFIYPRWRIDSGVAWQWLFPLAALAVLAGLVVLARRRRGPLAAALFFGGTLFPALGFVNVFPFIYSYVADHFQYLASLGVIVPVAMLTVAGAQRMRRFGWLRRFGAAVLLGGLAVLTWRQCGMYRDVEMLYRETLRRNPDCSMAHNNLGEILGDRAGGAEEALAHFEAAVRADPRNAPARNNLGRALAQRPGRLEDAIAQYREALRLAPGLVEAHNNLGAALARRPSGVEEAIAHYRRAAELRPGWAAVHDNLGVALLGMPGREGEAVRELETAARLAPETAGIRMHLGVALANVPGREAEARAELEAAVRLDPGSAEAQNNLGKLFLQTPGREHEALAHFETAVRSDPNFAEARDHLGRALLALPGRRGEALEHLRACVRLTPDSAESHYNLGVVLLNEEAGAAEARAELERAVGLKPEFVAAQVALGVALAGVPGREREAVQRLETALRLEPDNATARAWLERLGAGAR